MIGQVSATITAENKWTDSMAIHDNYNYSISGINCYLQAFWAEEEIDEWEDGEMEPIHYL